MILAAVCCLACYGSLAALETIAILCSFKQARCRCWTTVKYPILLYAVAGCGGRGHYCPPAGSSSSACVLLTIPALLPLAQDGKLAQLECLVQALQQQPDLTLQARAFGAVHAAPHMRCAPADGPA